MSKNVTEKNSDQFVTTEVLPVQPVNQLSANIVHVASMEQQSLRASLPHKNYDIIIRGKHHFARFQPMIPEHGMTPVSSEDWEFIKNKYKDHPCFVHKRIFAEKSEFETMARARDSESQELSKMTGSAQLTEKNLVASSLNPVANDGSVAEYGLTDAKVTHI